MLTHKELWLKKIEKKTVSRQKKRRPQMKVSGKSVLALKKIITDKSAGT